MPRPASSPPGCQAAWGLSLCNPNPPATPREAVKWEGRPGLF